MWPRLAAWFGATASSDQSFLQKAPTVGEPHLKVNLEDWARGKREVWGSLCEKAGVPQAKATFDADT